MSGAGWGSPLTSCPQEFKRELYQCKVDVESLRHQVGTAGTGQGDSPSPLGDFRRRWDRLEEEVVSRQVRGLGAAALGMGWHPSCQPGLPLAWSSSRGRGCGVPYVGAGWVYRVPYVSAGCAGCT